MSASTLPPTRTDGPSLDVATWARVGALSFGGPAGQIALMQRVLVDERRWISQRDFLAGLNFCMLLPGPEAQQLATWIGWRRAGWRGALVSGGLFVLPGALFMLGLSAAYVAFGRDPRVELAFLGVKCAVVAIVFEAVLRIARRALVFRGAAVVAAASLLAIAVFAVPFPLVVLAAAVLGYASSRSARMDATPVEPRPRHTLVPALLALVLWLAPVALLFAAAGGASVFTRIALFYSEMAVVTFGGAYAVLSYVADRAVNEFAWVTAAQMADGLGLAETTPGPLILVLQFIAFVAAHGEGPLTWAGFLRGAAASGVAVWVLFAPSFMWIFAGAPYIERINADPRLARALGFITAAVVGVVVSLALWFLGHVAFGELHRVDVGAASFSWPRLASFDPRIVLPLLVSALVLFVWKRGVLLALFAAAAVSLVQVLLFGT